MQTTFLNVLAGHSTGAATVSGEILVNGEPTDRDKMRKISGFVHQVRASVQAGIDSASHVMQ